MMRRFGLLLVLGSVVLMAACGGSGGVVILDGYFGERELYA